MQALSLPGASGGVWGKCPPPTPGRAKGCFAAAQVRGRGFLRGGTPPTHTHTACQGPGEMGPDGGRTTVGSGSAGCVPCYHLVPHPPQRLALEVPAAAVHPPLFADIGPDIVRMQGVCTGFLNPRLRPFKSDLTGVWGLLIGVGVNLVFKQPPGSGELATWHCSLWTAAEATFQAKSTKLWHLPALHACPLYLVRAMQASLATRT